MRKSETSQKLKSIMEDKNLRQIDVINMCKPICNKYGIPPITSALLSQYLSGKCEPMQTRLTVLAQALDVSEAWLMGYDVPMERDANNDEEVELLNAIEGMSENDLRKMLDLVKIAADLTDDQFEKMMAFARFMRLEGSENK